MSKRGFGSMIAEPVVLRCELNADAGPFAFSPADVALLLCNIEQECVELRVSLNVCGDTYRDVRFAFRRHFVRFVRDMSDLYSSLSGAVELLDFDEEVILSFAVVDRGRGRVAVGGHFSPVAFRALATTCSSLVARVGGHYNGGVHILFDGLVCDQSSLRLFVAGCESLINEHALEITNGK